LFDAVIPGDRVARGKPAPDGYVAALQHLQMAPAQAIAVEDSRHGIAAARAAGLTVIGIAPPKRAAILTAAGAAMVLPSASAITGVLRRLEACDA
jgi:beta-phosphoglucomutase-like phosphatase (HAD superfamily)